MKYDDDDDIGDDADDNSVLGEEEENEEELADVGWEPWKPQGRTSLPQPLVLYCSTPTPLLLEHLQSITTSGALHTTAYTLNVERSTLNIESTGLPQPLVLWCSTPRAPIVYYNLKCSTALLLLCHLPSCTACTVLALSFALVLQVQYCTVMSILFQNIVCKVNNIDIYLHSSMLVLFVLCCSCNYLVGWALHWSKVT